MSREGVRVALPTRPEVPESFASRWAGAATAPGGVESLDTARILPDPEAIRLVPRGVAVRYLLAPLALETTTVRIAMLDPSNVEALDLIEVVTGRRPVVTGQEGAEAVRIALEITDQIERNAALGGN